MSQHPADLFGILDSNSAGALAVTFERRYDTSPDDLWRTVTEPERLARWFAPVAGELREGGQFTIHFDDADVPVCRVEKCDTPTSFAWTWHHSTSTSRVEVEVHPEGSGSRLVLRHERIQSPDYAAGWQAHLLGLDDYLAGGDAAGDAWWDRFSSAQRAYAQELQQIQGRSAAG